MQVHTLECVKNFKTLAQKLDNPVNEYESQQNKHMR